MTASTRPAAETVRDAPAGERPGPSPRAMRALVWGGALVGLVLRAWVLAGVLGRPDEDEAVVGLMAQRLVHHGDFTTFFWGQHYGGSQESVVVALVFLVAGSGTLALKLVPIAFHAAAACLTWRIGRRTVGEPTAQVAGVLVWIFPGIYVWWSTKSRGFYGATLVLGLLVVLAVLRIAERPDVRDGLLLGGAAGMGLWASPQIAYFVVPSLLWLGWMRRRSWRQLVRPSAFALGAALIGVSPWVLYNARRGWAPLELMTGGAEVGGGHVWNDFVDVLRVALGIVPYSSSGWPLPLLTIPALAVLVLGFAWLVIRRPAGTGLLLLFVALYPLLWSRQHVSFKEAAVQPRYLYYLLPAVLLLLAAALRTWRRQVAAVVLLALLSAFGVASVGDRTGIEERPPDAEAMLEVLREEKVDRLYGYASCYTLAFLSEEDVVCAPVFASRQPRYDDQVRTGRHPAYLLPRGSSLDTDLRSELRRLDIGYRTIDVAGYALFLTDERVVPAGNSGVPFYFHMRLAKPLCRGRGPGCVSK